MMSFVSPKLHSPPLCSDYLCLRCYRAHIAMPLIHFNKVQQQCRAPQVPENPQRDPEQMQKMCSSIQAIFSCQIASDYLCLHCYRAHIAPPLTGVLFDKVQQCNNAEHHMNEKPQKTREKNVIKTLLYKTFTPDILLQIVLSLFAIIMNIAPPQ